MAHEPFKNLDSELRNLVEAFSQGKYGEGKSVDLSELQGDFLLALAEYEVDTYLEGEEVGTQEFIEIGGRLKCRSAENLGSPTVNLKYFREAFPHKAEFEIPEDLETVEINIILPEIRGREYVTERDGRVIHRKMRYFQLRRSADQHGIMIIRIK